MSVDDVYVYYYVDVVVVVAGMSVAEVSCECSVDIL